MELSLPKHMIVLLKNYLILKIYRAITSINLGSNDASQFS